MKIINKVWGWEVILVSTELYSCKLMVIKGGYQCSIHYHKLKDETFILLMGNVILEKECNIAMEFMHPNRIFPNEKHRFKGGSPFSVLLEVATQDLPDDSYRETKSGRIE